MVSLLKRPTCKQQRRIIQHAVDHPSLCRACKPPIIQATAKNMDTTVAFDCCRHRSNMICFGAQEAPPQPNAFYVFGLHNLLNLSTRTANLWRSIEDSAFPSYKMRYYRGSDSPRSQTLRLIEFGSSKNRALVTLLWKHRSYRKCTWANTRDWQENSIATDAATQLKNAMLQLASFWMIGPLTWTIFPRRCNYWMLARQTK